MDKRRSGGYKQISGHILIPLYRKFKATCFNLGIDHSTAIEEALTTWIDQQSLRQDETSRELAEFIKNLVAGEIPDSAECEIIAQKLGLTIEEVMALRDRTIKKPKKGN